MGFLNGFKHLFGFGNPSLGISQQLPNINPTTGYAMVPGTVGVASHLALDALYHIDVAVGLGYPSASALVPREVLDGGLAVMLLASMVTAYYWINKQ
ncbi:MAG: hypothetical protein ACM3X0_11375 [Bacteroidota bacterium]